MQKLRAFAGKRKSMLSAALCSIVVIYSSLVSFSRPSTGAQMQQDFGLPVLHTINSATLGPSYSCSQDHDLQRGYQNAGLFLSKYSHDMRSAELLFNGACRSADRLHSPGAGDSMNLIEDMGEIPLENVTAHSVFQTRGAYFESSAKVQINHTYAVLVNESDVRCLFVFTVVGHISNERLDIRYAVKDYQVATSRAQSSPGFDWGKGN